MIMIVTILVKPKSKRTPKRNTDLITDHTDDVNISNDPSPKVTRGYTLNSNYNEGPNFSNQHIRERPVDNWHNRYGSSTTPVSKNSNLKTNRLNEKNSKEPIRDVTQSASFLLNENLNNSNNSNKSTPDTTSSDEDLEVALTELRSLGYNIAPPKPSPDHKKIAKRLKLLEKLGYQVEPPDIPNQNPETSRISQIHPSTDTN